MKKICILFLIFNLIFNIWFAGCFLLEYLAEEMNIIKKVIIPKKEPNDSEKESNEEFNKKTIGPKPRAFCKKCNGTGRSENGVLICSTCKGTGLNRKHRERHSQ